MHCAGIEGKIARLWSYQYRVVDVAYRPVTDPDKTLKLIE